VRGGNLDEALLDGAKDTGNKRDPDAVAEFGVFEAQGCDLGRHRVAVLMPVGEPAGGQGKDGLHPACFEEVKGGAKAKISKGKP
jgi:hypothetical protein